MYKFTMLCGLPASGKSTYAETISGEVVSSDALRLELFGNINEQGRSPEVFAEMNKRTHKFLSEGKSVIYDATNLSRKRRIHLFKELNKYKYLAKEIVVFLVPLEELYIRDAGRDRQVGKEVILKMAKRFQIPFSYEGWHNIYYLSNYFKNSKFDIEKYNIPQDNKHHTLSLKEHLKKAFDIAIEKKFDDIVVEAALLHDIGKLYTKTFLDYKGKIGSQAHYYGHENVSAYYSFFYPVTGGNNALVNRALLIQWHMLPYGIDTKSQHLLSDKDKERIMQLHYADREAH